MHTGLFVVAMAVSVALPGSVSSAAEREFRGFAEIISGQNCSGVVGRDLLARFLPANVADNGNTTDLGLFGQGFAQGYHLNSGFYTNAFKRGTMTHVGSRFGDGADNPIQMRKVAGANPNNRTDDIILTIDIKGYDHQPRCIARLRLVLTRDVEG